MDVDKLITHLRYGSPYHGDVRRDTLDALERLAACEALEERVSVAVAKLDDIRSVMWEETVAEVVELLSDAP